MYRDCTKPGHGPQEIDLGEVADVIHNRLGAAATGGMLSGGGIGAAAQLGEEAFEVVSELEVGVTVGCLGVDGVDCPKVWSAGGTSVLGTGSQDAWQVVPRIAGWRGTRRGDPLPSRVERRCLSVRSLSLPVRAGGEVDVPPC